MKTEGQLKQKIKQTIYRHRKMYVEEGMTQKPANCSHNRRVTLPQYTGNRAALFVCGYEPSETESRLDVVCDTTMGGDIQARDCPHFDHCNTAQELKDDFKEKLGLDGSDVNIGVITKEYPDVAALMWVLGSGENASKEESSDNENSILAFFGKDANEANEELLEETDDES